METVTEGRALMIAVGHCCAAYESQMDTHTWRSVQTGPARYLAFLAANGYDLADVEKRATGLDKPARKPRTPKARKSATPTHQQSQDTAPEDIDKAATESDEEPVDDDNPEDAPVVDNSAE